ncbi:Pantetheinase [Nymphon striatum]|nr:Pantetheinase [Nymphon striatum]
MLPEVPDPNIVQNWNPCTDLFRIPRNDVLIRMSCAAKRKGIVVAFNYASRLPCNISKEKTCPSDHTYLFNTEIVFNSDGILLARYHKRHLFGESLLNPALTFEYTTFKTSFGKFGIFVCYDIAFKEAQTLVKKYDVDNIIYSTHWLDIYPTFTAVDVQSSFARKNQVNMLAANCHQPYSGAVGSGIYSGKYGAVNYTMNTSDKPKLLVSKVPINPKSGLYKPPNFINNETCTITVSQNSLKCHLEYSIKSNFKPGGYQFGALDGIFFSLPQRPLAFQIYFPAIITNYLRLAPSHEWIYENGSILSENGISRPIQVVSLAARNYDADPLVNVSKNGQGLTKESPVLFSVKLLNLLPNYTWEQERDECSSDLE